MILWAKVTNALIFNLIEKKTQDFVLILMLVHFKRKGKFSFFQIPFETNFLLPVVVLH